MAAHRACMIAAVVASALFLACYVYFHAHVGNILFLGQGVWRTIYFVILIPHVTLAIVIVPMVIITLSRGLRGRYDRHIGDRALDLAFMDVCLRNRGASFTSCCINGFRTARITISPQRHRETEKKLETKKK